MKFVPIFFLLIKCYLLGAQSIPLSPNIIDDSGKRQGKWTIGYDAEWNVLEGLENVSYYRIIEYDQDRPIGITRDYYASGQVQWEGHLTSDRPDVMDGQVVFYRQDGTKELVQIFDTGQFMSETNYDENEEVVLLWKSLDDLGVAAYNDGDYDQALQWFQRGIKKAEVEFGKEGRNYLTSLNNAAFIYMLQERYDSAEILFLASKNLRESSLGNEHPDYLISINNLAALYERMERFEKAELMYLEVKNTYERTEHAEYLTALNNIGIFYVEQEKYEMAKPLLEESIKISEDQSDTVNYAYFTVVNYLATVYMEQGEYAKAKPLFDSVGEFYEKNSDYEKPEYEALQARLEELQQLRFQSAQTVNSLLSQSDSLQDIGDFQSAELLLWEAKNLREKAYGEDAITANKLAELYLDQGQFDKAEPLYLSAKDIYERKFGKNTILYANATNFVGIVNYRKGNYDKAELFFMEAKDIREELLGREHPYYAQSLNNLAGLCQGQGLLVKAELLYLEVVSIRKKSQGRDHPNYAQALNNLGTLYIDMGQYTKSEDLFGEAIKIYEKTGERIGYATSLNNLATLYNINGDYVKAESLFVKGIEIREQVQGKKHPDYAITLNNIADIRLTQGQYSKAEAMYMEALGIVETSLDKAHPLYATGLSNLAGLHRKQKHYTKAEEFYLEALAIREKVYGKMHPIYAYTLNSLAVVYGRQGKNAKAEALFIETKDIVEKTLGKSHFDYAKVLNDLGSFYLNDAQYKKAEPLFLESFEIVKNSFGKDNPSYISALTNLGALYDDDHRYENAEPYYIESNGHLLNQIVQNFSHLSEKEKGKFYKTFSYQFEIFHSFMMRRMSENPLIINESYRIVLATKGLLFDGQKKIKDRIVNSGDDKLIALYDQWKSQLAYLSTLYQQKNDQITASGVDLKVEEEKANAFERELSAGSEYFGRTRDNNAYTWDDVKRKLDENEAAVEIVRLNYHEKKWADSVLYVAMIIKPETKDHPELVVLENGNELESKYLKNYKNSVKYQLDDKQSYKQYWDKINQALGGVKRVYVSQDGVFHSLSFGGLMNPETGNYLADELDIRIVASTKDLLTRKRKRNPAKMINLMGFPSYNDHDMDPPNQENQENQDRASFSRVVSADSLSRFFDGADIPLLPGTRVEVANLMKILNETDISVSHHLEDEATEAVIKTWKNPMIAHIATHGYFLKDEDITKGNAGLRGVSSEVLIENPLLRSGLLLANAKQAIKEGGEGVLTAYEAQNLHFDETELVVLSACETGLGDVKNGEGVYGLQRAFQAAGASSVLMSLWTVSDKATQELMTLFYHNWIIDKKPKREALMSAQLGLRENYPHPYYWAAFVMVGD